MIELLKGRPSGVQLKGRPAGLQMKNIDMALQAPHTNDPALRQEKQRLAFLKGLARKKPRGLEGNLPRWHREAFGHISCLDCAACCRGYSPRFKVPDIRRIARYLNLKESVFIEQYLVLDADGDYVARSLPCPFLGKDNACSIYEQRPRDCSRFPYSDEDIFLKRPGISAKNTTFCPAALEVLEKIKAFVSP